MKSYLEIADVERLEGAATNLRDRLLVRLLFRLGCRVSEAMALRPGDLDLVRGTVTILHLKQRLRLHCPQCDARLGRAHRFCPGCGQEVAEAVRREVEQRRVRALPLDVDTLGMVADYIRQGGPVPRKGEIFLFGISRHQAWRVVRECADRVGLGPLINPETGRLRGVSPHRLRDALATHAVKMNDSADGLRLLQEHLGHASFNTTARYRKVAGEEHRYWYDRLWDKRDS